MEISFKGALSKSEFLKAQKLHNRQKKYLHLVILIIFLINAVVSYYIYKDRNLLSILLFVIFFLILIRLSRKYQIRKYWNESQAIKEHCSVIATEQGITFTGERGYTKNTWDYFIKYKLSSDMVLLYEASIAMHIFPRSFFENVSDWDSFIQLVKDNVPSK